MCIEDDTPGIIAVCTDKKTRAASEISFQDSNQQQLTSSDNGGKRENMGKFQKAKSPQAYSKIAVYGKTGSGKTLTSLMWAEGLAALDGRHSVKVVWIGRESDPNLAAKLACKP
jgi:Cdc6-like AAA superfamily ATPase